MNKLNNAAQKFTSLVSPDSLRKVLQMSKSFYNNYTKENFGYEDIHGSQYYGVIKNFGTELLLESRKVLMDKPPLNMLDINNLFKYYFDIQYSDLIETYEQQGLLAATLNRDVFLSDKTYYIRFNGCVDRFILRSESWSDPDIHRDNFIHSTYPPTLVIRDNDTGSVEEIELKVSDGTDNPTNYYFFINKTTGDIIDKKEIILPLIWHNIGDTDPDPYQVTWGGIDSNTGDEIPLVWRSIGSPDEETAITIPLSNTVAEFPLIWLSVNSFKMLPNLEFTNNIDVAHKSLLTMGTDGNDICRLYPLVYGVDNNPTGDTDISKWFIKVYPQQSDSFINNINTSSNYEATVGSIVYVKSDSIGATPIVENTITFTGEFVKIKLSKDVQWLFKTPTSGDYDYDGTTYINKVYAYIPLSTFITNIPIDELSDKILSAFVVEFNHKYLNPYEVNINNAVTGIHVDSSSEYSDNSIIQKNGTIHGLGDFDGLPKYFKNTLDRKYHRSHVELYSIRDAVDNVNQHFSDKQLVGLILDSAVPQTELVQIDGLNSVIQFVYPNLYVTTGESVSSTNYLSDITYMDDNNFGNVNLPNQSNLPRFIYHGNRSFTLNALSFDPELEKARIYIVNNDSIEYNNNATSLFIKPPRTLARICDIPSSFIQLLRVEGISPTLVIDEKYTRMGTSLSSDDKDLIWNVGSSKLVSKYDNDLNRVIRVFDYNTDLNETLSHEYLTDNYSRWINLNTELSLDNTDGYAFDIPSNAYGFESGDTFTFIIGGLYFTGTIVDDIIGVPIEMSIDIPEHCVINLANLPSRITTYKTTTVTGNGYDLNIRLTINPTTWESLQPIQTTIYDDLYTYKFDKFGNVCLWEYNTSTNEWLYNTQITGDKVIDNTYDTTETQNQRTLLNTYMKNILNRDVTVNDHVWDSRLIKHQNVISTIQSTTDIETTTDLSSLIIGLNKQNTLYSILPGTGDFHTINTYQIDNTSEDFTESFTLPQLHQLNLSEYYNKSNMLSYSFYDFNLGETGWKNSIKYQPVMSVYNPFKNNIYDNKVISPDVISVSNKSDITFANTTFIDSTNSDELDFTTGILKRNVYSYDERTNVSEIDNIRSELSSLSRNQLIQRIIDAFGEFAKPLCFEDTEFAYTDSMLIDYIIDNSYPNPAYKKRNIRLLRQKNEKVVDYVSGKYVGIGEQPVGGYDIISKELFHPDIFIDNSTATAEILYIFRLETYPAESDMNTFKMFANGIDVSKYAMLICDNSIFVNVDGKWKNVPLG